MKIALTVLLLLAAWITDCDSLRSFAAVRPSNNHRLRSFDRIARSADPQNARTTRSESDEADVVPLGIEKETSLDDDDKSTLTLRGDFSFASADLPEAPSSIEDDDDDGNNNNSINDFFRRKATRDLLVTGGGERPCVETKPTPRQLKDWKKRCPSLGAVEPDENDLVLSVVSRGVQFPGLKVESNALIGAKYVVTTTTTTTTDEEERNNNPRYEFVLLSTEQIASGLPPAVWVYRKLTGAGGGGDGEGEENSTFDSLSTCTYEENKGNGTIAFRLDSFLSIVIKFPRFLTRILPVDKATMEERGGRSIAKTLDKDIMQSMKSLEKAYLESFDDFTS